MYHQTSTVIDLNPTLSELGVASSIMKLLAGSFSEEVVAIWGKNIGEYLSAPDLRRHTWHAWLSASGRHIETDDIRTSLAYRQLTFAKSRDLIEQAYSACPPGLPRLLGRLGATARRRKVYRSAVEVLAHGDPAARKLLHHANEISDDLILSLANLSGQTIAPALLALIKGQRVQSDSVAFVCWATRRLQSLLGGEAVEEVLAARRPVDALRHLILRFSFPPPPWPGTGFLVPLDSEEKLRTAGEELSNCMVSEHSRLRAVMRVLEGRAYYYRWLGEEPALLDFTRVGTLGWAREEALGFKNAFLSERTMGEITRSLADAEIMCPAPGAHLLLNQDRPFWDVG